MKVRTILALGGAAVALAGCGMNSGLFRDRSDLVAQPNACTAKHFDIYFADGEARLTEAARQAIGMTATQLSGCDIRKVQVLGLADARGGSQANQTLAQRRALVVADALAAAGWPSPAFDVTAAGDDGAVTAEGTREPMRRRTEVLVEAAPRG